MSMKVQIKRDACGDIIIQMRGDISYENAIPLREELQRILDENPHHLHYPQYAKCGFCWL